MLWTSQGHSRTICFKNTETESKIQTLCETEHMSEASRTCLSSGLQHGVNLSECEGAG